MKKTVFKPTVTTILHIAAGQQIDAFVHEGKVFVEYPTPAGIIGAEDTDSDEVEVEKTATATTATKSKVEETATKARANKKEEDEVRKVASAKASTSKLYTEEELMNVEDYPVKRLLEILDKMGVEVPKEGKNTNKKLRLLILEAQEGAETEEEEEEETPAPKGKASTKSTSKKEEVADEEEEEDEEEVLTDIFTRLEDEEIDEKAAVKELVDFGYEKKDATEMVDEFLDGEDTVEEFVADLLADDEEDEEEVEEEEEPAPAKKGKAAATTTKATTKKSAEKEVAIADLKVGDKVSVYFESEEDFVKGEVVSSKRGKVTVQFEDDTEEILDAEENSKILLLS